MQRKGLIPAAQPSTSISKPASSGYAGSSADTFEAVSKRYLSHQKSRLTPGSYRREAGIIAVNLTPFFGEEKKLAAIRRVDVEKYVRHRSEEVSPASVAKELKVLKHLLSLAMEWGLIFASPAQGLKAPPIPPGKVHSLRPTELETIIEACPKWLQPIVGFAFATGMKRGEILGLRWQDLDLKTSRIKLRDTTTGKGRTIYLNALAKRTIACVARAESRPTDRVFTGNSVTPDNVSLAFLRACRAVNIKDFRFHDLRHAAASWMMSHGVDIQTLSNFLGHKDLRTTAKYQHLSSASLPEAVKLLDGALTVNLSRKGPYVLARPAYGRSASTDLSPYKTRNSERMRTRRGNKG